MREIIRRQVPQSATLVTRVRVPFSAPRFLELQGWRSWQRIGFVHRSPRLDSGFLLQIAERRKCDAQCHAQSGTGSERQL